MKHSFLVVAAASVFAIACGETETADEVVPVEEVVPAPAPAPVEPAPVDTTPADSMMPNDTTGM